MTSTTFLNWLFATHKISPLTHKISPAKATGKFGTVWGTFNEGPAGIISKEMQNVPKKTFFDAVVKSRWAWNKAQRVKEVQRRQQVNNGEPYRIRVSN